MAITFGDEFRVPRSREEVFDLLTDPTRFGPLLPDFEGLTVNDPKNFTLKVKVGVAHIRGTATVQLRLEEAQRPQHALYKGKGSLAGGHVDLIASFDLEEDAGETRVRWNGEAQLFGPLTSVAGGLLQPLAKKNVQKFIDGLRAGLS